MMELSAPQSEKTNPANGSPSLHHHHHHQFVYPADLRVLGYAAGVLPGLSNTASLHNIINSPPSPTNPSSGSSSIGSPSHLSSANGFHLPRSLIFSDSEKSAAAFFWANNSSPTPINQDHLSPRRDDPSSHRILSPPHPHHHHPHPPTPQGSRYDGHSSPLSSTELGGGQHYRSVSRGHGSSSIGSISPSQSPVSPSSGRFHRPSLGPPQEEITHNSGAGGPVGNNNGSSGENNAQLMHWMSAVMAEHINHHTAVDGVHYVWNGGAAEGKLNSPENHHNSIKSVDQSSPNLPHLYGAPRSHNSGSSVSSSPPSSAGLVVPQPLSSGPVNIKGHNQPTNGSGRKYQCKMCPQIFTSKADLQLHTQIHMREAKPYKCSQCTKAFANSSYLSQHTRIHLGIKPYRCEICQRKFTQLSHLQQHIRTHTGDKPYKCRHPGCNKAFSQLSNLQSHSRCHQTDKPYKCNSCYKCFSDEASLLDHIPKHKESKHLKTHICNYCGKSYTQETYLTKHMQKHAEKSEKRLARQNNGSSNHHQTNGTSNGTNGQSHQVNNHQNSNSSGVLPSPEMYWKQELGESSPPSMCLPGSGQAILGRPGSEGPDDLRISSLGHHQQQSPPPTSLSYDAIANVIASSKGSGASAFTPIQTNGLLGNFQSAMLQIPGNMGGGAAPGRAYLPYEPLTFQKSGHHQMSMDMKSPGNSFPNQLISLHQIRNYAHQPSMTPEHLLGLKDK